MSHIKTQDPIETKDLHKYIEYVLTGEVKSEAHARFINQMAKRTVTLSDITVLTKILLAQTIQQQSSVMSQLMEELRIQHIVTEKLGATDEMIKEAKDQYEQELEDLRKKMEKKEEGSEQAEKKEEKAVKPVEKETKKKKKAPTHKRHK